MIITSGLFNNSVIQRNTDNVCEITLEGYLSSKEKPSISIHNLPISFLIDSIILTNFQIKKTKNYRYLYSFKTTLIGIPTGGPYDIVFGNQILTICNVLVGDIYLLAGQSNMQGIGKLQEAPSKHIFVRGYYLDDHWDNALDPLHDLSIAKEPIHAILFGGVVEPENPNIGVGPGIEFAIQLYKLTNVPQGLIACAHGGTTMEQWSPSYQNNAYDSLYHAMIRRYEKIGSHIKGLFWYQGCSDTDQEHASTYYENTSFFFSSLRRDISMPKLPIVAVQLSRVCFPSLDSKYWNKIQFKQYQLGQKIEHLQVVPSIDLEMDDFIHISSRSSKRLGTRCGNAMYQLTSSQSTTLPQISLKNIEVKTMDDGWNCKIILTFDHVVSKLVSQGKPNGFSISKNPELNDGIYIYHTNLKDNQVILYTTEVKIDVTNMFLHFGSGFHPYCNITDKADRSLPVLKGIALGNYRFFSEPCTKAWITNPKYALSLKLLEENTGNSFLQPFSPKKQIEYMQKQMSYKDFGYFYLNVFPLFHFKKENIFGVISYYFPFKSKITSKIDLLFGSNAILHLYCDGFLLVKTPFTKSPVSPDQYKTTLSITPGIHMLQVNLFCNKTYKPGIFLRFEQTTCLDKSSSIQLPIWINTTNK